jgi:hypothetical protein
MVIELVSLRLVPSESDESFVRAAEAATAFLRTCQGFLRRRLARGEDGSWVDYVEWDSMQDALSAARQFNHAPETQAFNAAIEAGSVLMRHLTVYAAADGCERSAP